MRWFHRINVACAVIVMATLTADDHAAVRLTALMGSLWLATLLVVPRLNNVSIFGRYKNGIQLVSSNRKYIGLWSAFWLVAHGSLATMFYFGTLDGLLRSVGQRPAVILEFVSLTIMILLALISNSWSMRHIKGWKYIQMAVWAVPPMALISSFVAAEDFLGQPPLFLMATVFLAVSVGAGVAASFSANKRPIDWWRIGFLAAGMAIALFVIVLLYLKERA